MNVRGPESSRAIRMLYDTGAERTCLSVKTAISMFGREWMKANRHNMTRIKSINASHGLTTEYVLPEMPLTITIPQQPRSRDTISVRVRASVSKTGMSLLGLDAISQLPVSIKWMYEDRTEKQAQSTTADPKDAMPLSWLK